MATKVKRNKALERNRDPLLKGKVLLGVIVSLLFLIPIIWMLFVSIKPDNFSTSNPVEWFLPPYTITNYIDIVMDSLILRWLFNSFFEIGRA